MGKNVKIVISYQIYVLKNNSFSQLQRFTSFLGRKCKAIDHARFSCYLTSKVQKFVSV